METGKYYNKTCENSTNRVLMTAGEAKKAASIVEEKIHDNISILHISGFVPVSNITVSIQGELLSTAQQAVITNATNVCFYSGCIPGSDI